MIVHNGVNQLFFAEFCRDGLVRPEILMVGQLSAAAKGHELVLRAIADLIPSFSPASMPHHRRRAGPYRLEALVRDLGIGSASSFAAARAGPKLAECDAALRRIRLPSRNEGLGCVYLGSHVLRQASDGCSGQGVDEVIEHAEWLAHSRGWTRTTCPGLSAYSSHPKCRDGIGTDAPDDPGQVDVIAFRRNIGEDLPPSHSMSGSSSEWRNRLVYNGGHRYRRMGCFTSATKDIVFWVCQSHPPQLLPCAAM